MLNFENAIYVVVNTLLVVTVIYVVYCKWAFTYWKKMNVECFEEPIVPLGNILWAWNQNFVFGYMGKDVYNTMKQKGQKHAGGFIATIPFYVVRDPEIIKLVLQKNFEYFPKRLYEEAGTYDPFAANLAFVSGERWSYLRAKLTPAFTPAKIKMLFDGMLKCADQMQEALAGGNGEAVDITKVAACYFGDVITVCAYGLDGNSFKNADSKFINHALNIIHVSSFFRIGKIFFKALCPTVAGWFRVSSYPKESTDFFVNFTKDAAKFRKRNGIVRKDLFQLMLDAETDLNVEELDDNASNSSKIIKDIASQVFLFFATGFETSSLTLSYCLYELSQNQEIQDKIREEIDGVLLKYEGKVTYEAIVEMAYLGQVVDVDFLYPETLRKYPPVPMISRKCVKDYNIGDSIIEEGTLVTMMVTGLHHDPEYYPDPQKFDPDRFSEENKQKRIPFTYLPFGEGPRNCPAYRFGLMQIKVGLVVLLQHFTLSLNKKTRNPIEMQSYCFTLNPKSAILLDVQNR